MSEAILEPTIDKSTWGAGPWQSEPDRLQWQHAGFACLMLRHPRYGCWCSYVGVDGSHPLYGVAKNELPDIEAAARDINYAAACSGFVCHVPEPGMPDEVWWLGMDFGHAWDLSPGLEALERSLEEQSPKLRQVREELEKHIGPWERYRDQAYVKEATEKLAEQLRALAAPEMSH